MPRISQLIPTPGAGELESIARAIFALLKDENDHTSPGAELKELLGSIMEQADKTKKLESFTIELREIQSELQAANKLKFRQQKLKIWYALTAKLKQKMSFATLSLVAQLHEAQTEHTVSRPREHRIIDNYQISNDVERHTRIWPEPEYQEYYPTRKPVRITLRSGRIEKMEVSYLTFTESPEGTADEHVKEAIKCIRQYNHVNVAKFVGVTEGYSGLDGIVVAMDGIEFSDFLSRTHSGAVWAECIRGFEAFAGLAPKWRRAERITVAQNGRVVILPARSGGMHTEFGRYSYHAQMLDPGAKLLMKIYAMNCDALGSIRLCTFIDSLAKLGLGFTELDVMNLAADCRLFPFRKIDCYYDRGLHLPRLQSNVGGIGRASYSDRKHFPWESLVGWESFGRSPYVQDKDLDPPRGRSSLEWCKSITPDGAEWLTYILPVSPSGARSRNSLLDLWACGKQVNWPFRFDWNDIFTDAQETSQRLEVDLSDISFLSSVGCVIHLSRPQEANWDEIPVNLYFHWSPQGDSLGEVSGFYSADKTPDGGAWQERLQIRGWAFWFHTHIITYRMDDDWGLQYERELKRIMVTTPGSYPGAQVEEV